MSPRLPPRLFRRWPRAYPSDSDAALVLALRACCLAVTRRLTGTLPSTLSRLSLTEASPAFCFIATAVNKCSWQRQKCSGVFEGSFQGGLFSRGLLKVAVQPYADAGLFRVSSKALRKTLPKGSRCIRDFKKKVATCQSTRGNLDAVTAGVAMADRRKFEEGQP